MSCEITMNQTPNQALKNTMFSVAAAVILLWTAGSSLRAQSGETKPKPKTTQEAFKNIQVLKDLPSGQLIPAMQFITASLGVECDFCHVRGAFDKDDKKPKQTVRKMMQMMFALNQQNFDGRREVTCYSCHRGSSKPVSIPMVGDTTALEALEDFAPSPRCSRTRQPICLKPPRYWSRAAEP